MTLELITILVLLLCGAMLSAGEIGITMASRVRLRTRAERGSRGAAIAERLLAHPDRAIATCLVGNTLVQVGMAAFGRAALKSTGLGEVAAEALATVLLVPIVLLGGETLPKAIAQMYPNRTLSALAVPLRVVHALVWPLAQVSFGVVAVVRRVARLQPGLHDVFSREELKRFIAHSEKHGHVDETERDLIARIVEFWRADPERFAKPAAAVPHLDAETSAAAAREWMRARQLPRVLVVRGPDVAGVVTAAAIVDAPAARPLGAYAQPAVSVHPEHGADRVMAELQRSPSQVGILRGAPGEPARVLLLDDLLHQLLGIPARGLAARETP